MSNMLNISGNNEPRNFRLCAYEAERHRPAPRSWASFYRAARRAARRAAPCVANIKKYAIFHLEFENYGPLPTHFH